MSELVKERQWWRCNRYPWGCNKQHATKEEADKCELNRKPSQYVGTTDAKAYL